MVQSNGHISTLSILNRSPSLIQGPQLLHDLVRRSSDVSAIDFLENGSKRRTFGYETLHTLSDILAGRITQISTTFESVSPIIPVILPQCPELYIVLLAVLKAGKAFCPISPDTPRERLKFILQDLAATFVITSSAQSEQIRTVANVQTILADQELIKGDDKSERRLPAVSTDSLAYVLYTSGSTGLPKAVSVSHRAVSQSLLAHDRHIPDFARFLQFAAPTFDVSIFEIFFPWFRGRTLVGCTRAQMLNDLPGTIARMHVDAAELTPTVVGNLLHGRSSVPSLRLLLTIGEMLTQYVVDEYGGSETRESMLWAMYGPTEAAIHCTLQPYFSTSASINNIGFPLDTVSIFIAAPSSGHVSSTSIEVLAVDEVGELVLGGPQVAEEYLNRPDLTAASFLNHPEYGRLYRTGDKARLRFDGQLECLGRVIAGQVKLRGQRVELGEVEQVISRIEECRMAIAMVIEDRLVAFCSSVSESLSCSEVLSVCQDWLPGFMVPSDIHFVNALPQLASGKVDKSALKKEYLRTLQVKNCWTPDENNHVECTVHRILQEHAKQDFTLSTDFESAGLDSLQAIRVASAMQKQGFNVSALDFLVAGTLQDLLTTCGASLRQNGAPGDPEFCNGLSAKNSWPEGVGRHEDILHILPCTPLQEAMLAETTARSRAYCNWIEMELSLSCTLEQIQSALQALAEDNEILRTGFCNATRKAGTFDQIIWKTLLPTQLKQVSSFSREYALPNNEAFGRPLSIQIIVGSARPRLLFQLHHALYDGWSFDLLLQDLDRHLRGGIPISRPQFRDVALYYSQDLKPSDTKSAKEYWSALLSDYIPTPLTNYNGKDIGATNVQVISGRSAIQSEMLFEHAQKLSINPQVYFQAAVACVLRLYSGSQEVTFGNVTSGRTIPVASIEHIMGPCMALQPFRFSFEDTFRAREILQKTHQLNRQGLQHCTLPLREIARAANVPPGTRLFDVLFVWQQSLSPITEAPLLANIVDSADDLEFKITLEFEPRQDYISFRATFDPSSVPEHQTRYLCRQIDEIVALFLTQHNCPLADIDHCFTEQSLSIANPNPCQIPIEHGPSYAVEQWALRTPDKAALIFGQVIDGVMQVKDTITYAMLNSRANQLARFIAVHITHHDQLIGIFMEKSIEFYISVLAIIKLGCGYLPLTPDMPEHRLQSILEDAQIEICLSTSLVSHLLPKVIPCEMIHVDSIQINDCSAKNLDVPYNGTHLAYAIFTSGSTGTPKGVLVTQDNLMSNLEYLSTVYPVSAMSIMLQACSLAFDVSVFEIFFTWHVGMSLCTASKDDIFRDIEAAINGLQVTHLSLTPTVAALVDPRKVPKVDFLVTAGEALTEHVRRQWAGKGLYQGESWWQ